MNNFNQDLNNSMISSMLILSDYFAIFPAIQSGEGVVFNVGFLLLSFGILLFLVIGGFYIHYQENQEDVFNKEFKNTWGILYDSLDKILSIPIYGLSFANIQCKVNIQCYTSIHIFLVVISAVSLVLITILEIMYAQLFFNFTFKIKDNLSRNPSTFSLLFLFCKIMAIYLYIQMDLHQANTYASYVLIHIVIASLMLYDSLASFPYHQKNVSKAHGIFCASYFWINSCLFILYVLDIDLVRGNVLIIVGLGITFFVKLYLNIRNFQAKLIMNSELTDINSDVLLDLKIRAYNSLAKSLHVKKSELLFASLLKIHHDKCVDTKTCPCHKRGYLYDPKKQEMGGGKLQFHRDTVFVKHFISRMIQDGLFKFRNSKLLYLDHLVYQFEALRLYPSIQSSILDFSKTYLHNISLSIHFCLYRLQEKLKAFIIGKNQKNPVSHILVIENVRLFDRGMQQIREQIKQVAKVYGSLWETLTDQVPDLYRLLQICNDNFINIMHTNNLYSVLISINNTSQELRNIMDIYAIQIVFDELLAMQIAKDTQITVPFEIGNSLHQDIDYLLKKLNIFEDKTCVISISSKQDDTINQITWASKTSDRIFGISNSALLGRTINELMPGIYSIHHDKILKNFLRTGQELSINNIMHTWALDHSGLCFSVNLFVKIVPAIKDGSNNYDIMSLFHRLNDNDYIITDYDGEILCYGKRFAELLEIDHKFFLEQRINIQLFAPLLMAYFKDYFSEFDETEEEPRDLGNNGKSQQQPGENADQGGIVIVSKGNSASAMLTVIGTNADKAHVQEVKFYLFIPTNLQEMVCEHIEKRKTLFKKFFNEENSKEKDRSIKDLKVMVQFKSEYINFLQNGLKKLNWKKLSKVVKMKAEIQTVEFFNGSKKVHFKAIKIQNTDIKDIKKTSTSQHQIGKMKKQEKFIKHFIGDLRKLHEDVKIQKFKNKQLEQQQEKEEEKAQKELENQTNSKTPGERNLKGIMNLFKKPGQGNIGGAAGLAGLFANLSSNGGAVIGGGNMIGQQQNKIANAFSVFKIKQQGKKPVNSEEEKKEIDDSTKRTILSLFKPSNKWIRAARNYRDNGDEEATPDALPNHTQAEKQNSFKHQFSSQNSAIKDNSAINPTARRRTSKLTMIFNKVKSNNNNFKSIQNNTRTINDNKQKQQESDNDQQSEESKSDSKSEDKSQDQDSEKPINKLKKKLKLSKTQKAESLEKFDEKKQINTSFPLFQNEGEGINNSNEAQATKGNNNLHPQQNSNNAIANANSSSSISSQSKIPSNLNVISPSSNQSNQRKKSTQVHQLGAFGFSPNDKRKSQENAAKNSKQPNIQQNQSSPSNQQALKKQTSTLQQQPFAQNIRSNQRRPSRIQQKVLQRLTSNHGEKDMKEDIIKQKEKDIVILPTLPMAQRIRKQLLKTKNIGQRPYSIFYGMVVKDEDAVFDLEDVPKRKKDKDKTQKPVQSDELTSPQRQGDQLWKSKVKDKFTSGQLKTIKQDYREEDSRSFKSGQSQTHISNSSSSSDDDGANLDENMILLQSQKSQNSIKEERNLLVQLQKKDIKEEEINQQQSVGSSTASSTYAQNALRLLRSLLQSAKTPFILSLANFVVILACLALFCASIAQLVNVQANFNIFQDQLSAIERLTSYSENITRLYEQYQDIMMLCNGIYLSPYNMTNITGLYPSDDQKEIDQYNQWWDDKHVLIANRVSIFTKFFLKDLTVGTSDLVDSITTIDEKSEKLKQYLFEKMNVSRLIDKIRTNETINFQTFVRLFLNAINQTMKASASSFHPSNIENNDFLYLISSNLQSIVDQNQINLQWIQNLINHQLDLSYQQFLGIWIFCYLILLVCFIVIYPILLQSKVMTHDSLVLFTRISMHDVEHYSNHYKKIYYLFNNVEQSSELVKQIDKYIEYELALQTQKKKEHDNKMLSRSRPYRGVSINRILLIIQMLILIGVFIVFIFFKDFQLISFISNAQYMKDRHIASHNIIYNSTKTMVNYKILVTDFILKENKSDFLQRFNTLNNSLFSKVSDLLITNYDLFSKYDKNYKEFINQFITKDLCLYTLVLEGEELSQCQKLDNQLLQKGFLSYFFEYDSFISNSIESINKQYEISYASARDLARKEIQQQNIQDQQLLFEFVSRAAYTMYNFENNSIKEEIANQLTFQKLILLLFIFTLFLFLIFIWVPVFYEMKQNSQWVGSFILLIPIQLLRENQYLRSYLKRKLKLTSLNYV